MKLWIWFLLLLNKVSVSIFGDKRQLKLEVADHKGVIVQPSISISSSASSSDGRYRNVSMIDTNSAVVRGAKCLIQQTTKWTARFHTTPNRKNHQSRFPRSHHLRHPPHPHQKNPKQKFKKRHVRARRGSPTELREFPPFIHYPVWLVSV